MVATSGIAKKEKNKKKKQVSESSRDFTLTDVRRRKRAVRGADTVSNIGLSSMYLPVYFTRNPVFTYV